MINRIFIEMKKHGLPNVQLVNKAYEVACTKHGDSKRKGGMSYVEHVLDVAYILAKQGHGSEVVAAALLHDVLEDGGMKKQELEDTFGTEIADAVDAVTKESAELETSCSADEKFKEAVLNNHNRMALFIKCAECVHNLNTITALPKGEHREKAEYVRHEIVPLAKQFHMLHVVDTLESLCLKCENPELAEELDIRYRNLLESNKKILTGPCGLIEHTCKLILDNKRWGRYMCDFEFVERSLNHVFEDVVNLGDTVAEIGNQVNGKNVALYDVFFITNMNSPETPQNLFFKYYDHLFKSKHQLTVRRLEEAGGMPCFIMQDKWGFTYRLFVQSEKEHFEFIHGISFTDSFLEFRRRCDESTEQTDRPSGKMITVYKEDGSPMQIEDGATVLDFAFALNPSIGICAKYAWLLNNNKKVKYQLHRKLVPKDRIEIVSDHVANRPSEDIPHANIRWFEYVYTRKAIHELTRWFEKNMHSSLPMITVECEGKKYEMEMGATVLDMAFAVNKTKAIHLQKAYVNQCKMPSELNRILRHEDKVRFEYDKQNETAEFKWIKAARTARAKECLIGYFETKYELDKQED